MMDKRIVHGYALSIDNGQAKMLDKTTRESLILSRACAAGKPWGLNWEIQHPPTVGSTGSDAYLRLHYAGLAADYVAKVKRTPSAAQLGDIVRGTNPTPTLFVAEYIPPALADQLRNDGHQFIDAAGNAYLQGASFQVLVAGQRAPRDQGEAQVEGRAYQSSGLRVLFALLCQPDAVQLPYREIATQAGVAHGTVGWVMPELERMRFLGTINGTRRLFNTQALMKEWVEAYPRRLRPKLVLGRYQSATLDWVREFARQSPGVLLGSEFAAQTLTHHLQPGSATFYVDALDPQHMAKLGLRPDRNGNVEFLAKFWNFDSQDTELVPQFLVYADLLASGDSRCQETAALLYESLRQSIA